MTAFWNQVLANWQFGYLLIPAGALAFLLVIRGREPWFLVVHVLIGTIFWIGFTHLQGRFYVLTVPLVAMLIGYVGTPANGWHCKQTTAIVATLVLAGALIAMIRVNVELLDGSTNFRLYGQHSFIGFLGTEDLSGALPKEFEQLPADATLVLVGDARAFWYPIPMSRLRYRTVFDVNGSRVENLIEAWAKPLDDSRQDWVWIDPLELQRFSRTYHPLPPLPPEILQRDQPFMIKPAGK